MYRVLIGILVILFTNATFALDSEYKNTLNKVELNKTSDSSYSVNLYTAKEYLEPVKVIKKSDLNYYVLLPETKNLASIVLPSGTEIKSVNTQLFPYAGADVKNGYTKINIVTSKPIDFTVNAKTKVAVNNKKPVETEVKKEETKTTAEAKAQKKNSDVLAQKLKPSTEIEKNKVIAKQETKLVSKENKLLPKQASKPVLKQEVKPTLKQENQKSGVKELKNEVAAAAKVAADKKEEVKKKLPEKKPELKQENVKIDKPIEEKPIDNDSEEDKQVNIDEENDAVAVEEETADTQTNVQEVNQTETEEDIEVVKGAPESASSFLLNVKSKLAEYGLSLRELLLMIFAGVLSFVVMLLILTKQKDSETRLKSKAEFIEKTTSKNSTLVAKKTAKKNNDGQYFIFDKNVKQTGFSNPASGNKNYELSSYSPIQESSVKVEPYVSNRVKSEYDIIQNILKEDAFIELSDNEIPQDTEPSATVEETTNNTPSESKIEPELAAAENDEPQVISNVEIAPQRGFMCVSYNNTINLMGYIFDDIFALYNFKQPKLEDYNIKFRMSEKTKQGANFLVRVGKSKMLVSVTKSSMSLEVAM